MTARHPPMIKMKDDKHMVFMYRLLAFVGDRNGRFGERGQSTAEYALLLLGAATIAMLVVSWAAGTGKIEELFNAVVDSIIGRV